MEAICDSNNIETALSAQWCAIRVRPGVDGITVKQLPGILKARWSEIENQLLQGRYQPQPVRRVRIPQPGRWDAQPRHSNRDRIRRRLRCVVWVQWKTRRQRYRELRR